MSKKKTLISEIVTGLGTLGRLSLEDCLALPEPPQEVVGVDHLVWIELQGLWSEPANSRFFEEAHQHGRYFLNAEQGLRGRTPRIVEWKGPHRPPEVEPLPADLRIDHVYTISCKNLSKVLRNPSPFSLFRSALKDQLARGDWYADIAGETYEVLLDGVSKHFGLAGIPRSPVDLDSQQREILKELLADGWPNELQDVVEDFIRIVSERSAEALLSVLRRKQDREAFYWRLLRLHSAPYFILGTPPSGPSRLRVLTPWDFQRSYDLLSLEISADRVGQPQVRWLAHILDRNEEVEKVTEGHFEVRWSHGKFCGAPEAKVYLDTPHDRACGYVPI